MVIIDGLIALTASTWKIIEDSALFILFGFFLAGIIKAFVPMEAVKKSIGSQSFGSVVKAALFGLPLPLCSCSVIPTAIALRKQGASKGAVSAFLISTPESGVDSITISYALLDPIMTVFRPIAAFITAFFAGLLEVFFGVEEEPLPDAKKTIAGCACSDSCEETAEPSKSGKIRKQLLESLHFGFIEMMDDLVVWMLFGLVVAGAVMAFVPEHFFLDIFGDGVWGLPAMFLLGTPIYICATSSTPMAAAMIVKGLSPGAALVFLLAGPATNIGSIIILRGFMGARSMWIYLFSIAFCSIALGLVLDMIYRLNGIDPVATIGVASDIFPHNAETVGAVIFTSLSARSLITKYGKKVLHGQLSRGAVPTGE